MQTLRPEVTPNEWADNRVRPNRGPKTTCQSTQSARTRRTRMRPGPQDALTGCGSSRLRGYDAGCCQRTATPQPLLTPAATAATPAARRTRGAPAATLATEPTSTPTTPAATTPAAASGRTPLTSHVEGDRTTIEGRAVERLNGSLGVFRRAIFDEAKAAGLPRGPIDDDASRNYLAELGEGFLELLVHRRVRQIAHIQPVSHYYSISIAWHRSAMLRMRPGCRQPHPNAPTIGSSQHAEHDLERARTTDRYSTSVSGRYHVITPKKIYPEGEF
jgi:hypothetical protein